MKLIDELDASMAKLVDPYVSSNAKCVAIQTIVSLWDDESNYTKILALIIFLEAQFQFMLAGGFQALVKNIMSIDEKLHFQATNSLISIARKALISTRFRESFPRFILMDTRLFTVVIDLIYIYLPEHTPPSQTRTKM